MKVYLVNREDNDGEYGYTTLMKIFSTREKAQAYVNELCEKYKDKLEFQYKQFYFDIEEEEVEYACLAGITLFVGWHLVMWYQIIFGWITKFKEKRNKEAL